LPPLRISIVEYLNTAPLVWGFSHGPLRGKYDLSFTVPSQCAEALRTNAVDIAIIPAIEYQRIDDLVILPDLAIASKKSVRSLLLISKRPIRETTRIALDRSSRSTQALTRILCARHWNSSPEFFESEPDLRAMLKRADAALVIGDPALRVAIDAEASARRIPSGDLTCSGTSLGIDSEPDLFIYDIVENWRSFIGLPAVLAVWATRKNIINPEIAADFRESRAFGMRHLDEICAEASKELNLPAGKLRRYLTENIDYTLDDDNLAGLGAYFNYAAEVGCIPTTRAIEFSHGDALPASSGGALETTRR
jgi:chorismate dehydratase